MKTNESVSNTFDEFHAVYGLNAINDRFPICLFENAYDNSKQGLFRLERIKELLPNQEIYIGEGMYMLSKWHDGGNSSMGVLSFIYCTGGIDVDTWVDIRNLLNRNPDYVGVSHHLQVNPHLCKIRNIGESSMDGIFLMQIGGLGYNIGRGSSYDFLNKKEDN